MWFTVSSATVCFFVAWLRGTEHVEDVAIYTESIFIGNNSEQKNQYDHRVSAFAPTVSTFKLLKTASIFLEISS